MKRLAIVTATRAEYGLLAPVIRELRAYENDLFKAELIVTGTHLVSDYGMTIEEIRADGMRIDVELPIPTTSKTSTDISRNQAAALISFAGLFEQKHYDAVLVLGDRYEILSVVIAAANALIPVFHLCGGDVTEGAVDDCIRHSITKMSWLHFPTNEESRKRIVQLGEEPSRVFNYGSTSIDNTITIADMPREDVLDDLGLPTQCRYAVCTYHPVTLEEGGVQEQIMAFVAAMSIRTDMQFIVTKSNSDRGGALVNALLDAASTCFDNIHVFASLGVRRYLSLMRGASFVLGNSSSGIVEAPALRVPTINIGDRQRGRLRAASIIDCATDTASILRAIEYATSEEMRVMSATVVSPYGDGQAAPRIAAKCLEVLNSEIDLKKRFYRIEFDTDRGCFE